MNVKKDNTFLWRVHAKRVTNVNVIEQHLSMHLFKARTDFSVEPQSILNKRSDNVYLCLLSSFYTLFITECSTSFLTLPPMNEWGSKVQKISSLLSHQPMLLVGYNIKTLTDFL